MCSAINASAKNLGGLSVPEHRAVGRANNHIVFDYFKRINGWMSNHRTIRVEITLQGIDRVLD